MYFFHSTPRCILRHGNDFIFEYLHEFSAKIKIIPGERGKGERRTNLMQNINTQKSRDTAPLSKYVHIKV